MTWHTTEDELVRQHVDDVCRVQLPADPDCQAFPGELVEQVEHAELSPVMGPGLDEVVRPDMVRALGPQTDARPVVEPEPFLLRLLRRHLQLRRGNAPLGPFLILLSPAAVDACADPSTRFTFTVQPHSKAER